VVDAESAEESRVGDEEAPALADDGGAWEGGGLRWEAEEDLSEQIVDVQRRGRRRRAGAVAEAAHLNDGGAGCKLGCFLFRITDLKTKKRLFFFETEM
jgi:hypothetical protein